MSRDLPDPETCRDCGTRGKVIDSKRSPHGYRWRRHECQNPDCGYRWSTWQTVLSYRLRFKDDPAA